MSDQADEYFEDVTIWTLKGENFVKVEVRVPNENDEQNIDLQKIVADENQNEQYEPVGKPAKTDNQEVQMVIDNQDDQSEIEDGLDTSCQEGLSGIENSSEIEEMSENDDGCHDTLAVSTVTPVSPPRLSLSPRLSPSPSRCKDEAEVCDDEVKPNISNNNNNDNKDSGNDVLPQDYESEPEDNKESQLQELGHNNKLRRKDSRRKDDLGHNKDSIDIKIKEDVYNFTVHVEDSSAASGSSKNPTEHHCVVCDKQFAKKRDLSRHLVNEHAGIKLYACVYCQRSFARKKYLTNHLKIHDEEKPYSCSVCTKSFRHSGTLTDHMRSHRDERHYACDICDKSFVTSSSLKRHSRTHSGLKPYTCATCGKSYAQSNVLKRHQLTHTGATPYSCFNCGKCFSQSYNLDTHIKSANCSLTS